MAALCKSTFVCNLSFHIRIIEHYSIYQCLHSCFDEYTYFRWKVVTWMWTINKMDLDESVWKTTATMFFLSCILSHVEWDSFLQVQKYRRKCCLSLIRKMLREEFLTHGFASQAQIECETKRISRKMAPKSQQFVILFDSETSIGHHPSVLSERTANRFTWLWLWFLSR